MDRSTLQKQVGFLISWCTADGLSRVEAALPFPITILVVVVVVVVMCLVIYAVE
jgi:hypothetical protein